MAKQDEYIDLLKSGDQAAFRSLVEEHQQIVFTTCMGIVHNEYDADDVTQDVFIQAYHSIHSFRADAKLSTWLCRMAINKSLNFVRDNKRKQFFKSLVSIDENEIEDLPSDLESAENESAIRAQQFHKAIDRLPKKQRTAFVLCKYDEMSYKDIAEVMQISLSSVESLLFRARKSLQKKLSNLR